MAKRNNSDAPQHETIPGPGPAKQGEGTSGIHPVEQMVDAAIDRIAREHQASRDSEQKNALAVRIPKGKSNGRLRWKGLDVSDDFKRYAERIARGEELPPYEGQILAEPNPTFPWEPSDRRSASRKAFSLQLGLGASAAVVTGLIAWSLVAKFGAPASDGRDALVPAPFASTEAPPELVENPLEVERMALQPSPEEGASTPSSDVEAAPTPAAASEAVSSAPPAASVTPVSSAGGVESRLPKAPPTQPPAPVAASPAVSSEDTFGITEEPASGALKEAIGALLAARAASSEFPESTPASPPAASSAGGAPAGPPAPNSAPVNPGPVTAAPNASGSAPARKEPENGSSAKGSLLVETPSF